MKVKALRGVCIGVDRHLIAGDVVDLEPGLVTFLSGIGAVAIVPVEPPKPDAPSAQATGQTTPQTQDQSAEFKDPPADTKPDSPPAKSGKKEK
jgi:hypothetical protein